MPRSFLLLLGAICVTLSGLVGCQTALNFAAPEANWKTYLGQMHYSNGTGRSVVGEVVARRSPDGSGFQLQFSSGPGFPLLKLYESGATVRAEGVFARGRWQGQASAAPAQLRNWVRLGEVFGQLQSGRPSLSGPGWTAQAQSAGGKTQTLIVSFAAGGERFAFHFNP